MIKLKIMGKFLLTIIICIAIFILMIIICTLIPLTLLSPEGTIFWICGPWYSLIFVFEIVLIIAAVFLIKGRNKNNKDTVYAKFPKLMKRYFLLIVIGGIIFVYAVVIDTTYITNEKIIKREFFNPFGKEYSYSDVIGVDTGFYGKKGLRNLKGDFYYYIRLIDGTRIQLSNTGGINEDMVDNYDTYKEIEVIDNKLMQNKIVKISSQDYSEFCRLASAYKNRLLSIIQNK